MKIALYGLPCSGKTTLLNVVNIPVIHGSTELSRLSDGRFSELPEGEKTQIRIQYAEELSKRQGSFISDGHYSFYRDVVFTEADSELYDVFIYLYCSPKVISERLKKSEKNTRFSALSTENINKWQNFEIEELRQECHTRNKDFYVINNVSETEFQSFISDILDGFSSRNLAKKIVCQIQGLFPDPCPLVICDGDKTVIREDTFQLCSNGYVTHVFDGSFYTSFQAMRFNYETEGMPLQYDKLNTIRLNEQIFDKISDKNYIILSSGINRLWRHLTVKLGLKNVIADSLISADTKYFVVKILREIGYYVTAYGDSKNDLYMLKEANEGFLYIGERISRSLYNTDVSGVNFIYDKKMIVLNEERDDLNEDIAICKSSSGINGARLATSHFRLGQLLGEYMARFIPSQNTAVLELERGGRFFGDGVYTSFGGIFYSYDSKQDKLPEINSNIVVIVDSVINTGTSVLKIIDKIRSRNSKTEIFLAANVVQRNTLLALSEYKIFTIRVSDNSYIGKRQDFQNGNTGPDTADRLFNYIN